VAKLFTLISGCWSYIKSVSLINNSQWLKAEAKISGFLSPRNDPDGSINV